MSHKILPQGPQDVKLTSEWADPSTFQEADLPPVDTYTHYLNVRKLAYRQMLSLMDDFPHNMPAHERRYANYTKALEATRVAYEAYRAANFPTVRPVDPLDFDTYPHADKDNWRQDQWDEGADARAAADERKTQNDRS